MFAFKTQAERNPKFELKPMVTAFTSTEYPFPVSRRDGLNTSAWEYLFLFIVEQTLELFYSLLVVVSSGELASVAGVKLSSLGTKSSLIFVTD